MNLIRYAYNRFSTERFPLPTEEQVCALERQLGIEFPPDYREFLLQFNGGYFDTPIIEPIADDCPEDALLFLCGIGASHREAELADDCYISLFEENDPLKILPIGVTDTGGLIILTVEEDGYGEILFKEAYGGFYYLAPGVEEFFELLREDENRIE